MILRILSGQVLDSLKKFPVVGLIGPRQAGKTTLAKGIAAKRPDKVAYLDLELPSDRDKLEEAELYLRRHPAELIVLDEIQRVPELFPLLRAVVDEKARPGQFLILGSASPSLLRQSSESLAGRIIYHELEPLVLKELPDGEAVAESLWLRGGFPRSYLAATDRDSFQWRGAFIRACLERDLPQFGARLPVTTLHRLWMMIAHCHGQLWNASKIASSLGIVAGTVKNYLDLLTDLFLLRQLPPLFANVKKRLVKSPKVYVRDSGLLHTLLGIQNREDIYGHPKAGASWEGWALEQILAIVPRDWDRAFYRTSAGAEI
ncbi:MAG: ATP-binding protein, partial [Pirellulales bacterium]|nr:ATP-binding protein [Pirellulales bacterium]